MASHFIWSNSIFSLYFSPHLENAPCSVNVADLSFWVQLVTSLTNLIHPWYIYLKSISRVYFKIFFRTLISRDFFLLYYFSSTKYIVTMKVWLPIQEILWKITPFIVLISKLVSIVIVSSSRMTKSFWAIIKVSTCTKMFWQSCQSNIKPFTCTSLTLI